MDMADLRRLIELPLAEVMAEADKVRAAHRIGRVDLCTIMNAKSGRCSEDCRFCAQSGRHATGVPAYPLKAEDEIVDAAKAAKESGSMRFSVVTSGNRLTKAEIASIARAKARIRDTIGIKLCASLGNLDEEDLALLKRSGVERYHHNIETSRRYFPHICTTHTFDDRVGTIRAARRAGLEVCSGGIIGMGETWADRIDMALTLRDLGVASVPLNVLVPIAGTPLGGSAPLSGAEAIRTIAIFRIALGGVTIKVAAGRESVLKDFQAMAFMAGANGMLIGGYLTTAGRDVAADKALVEEVEREWNR